MCVGGSDVRGSKLRFHGERLGDDVLKTMGRVVPWDRVQVVQRDVVGDFSERIYY